MEVEYTKSGAKIWRYSERPRQIDGGFEDTMMQPCDTRGCQNRFETVYPEPGEGRVAFCPDCTERREIWMQRWEAGY